MAQKCQNISEPGLIYLLVALKTVKETNLKAEVSGTSAQRQKRQE